MFLYLTDLDKTPILVNINLVTTIEPYNNGSCLFFISKLESGEVMHICVLESLEQICEAINKVEDVVTPIGC